MQSVLKEIPAVTHDLVEFLDAKWSLEYFNSIKSIEDLNLHKGRREVISFLKQALDRQTQRIF